MTLRSRIWCKDLFQVADIHRRSDLHRGGNNRKVRLMIISVCSLCLPCVIKSRGQDSHCFKLRNFLLQTSGKAFMWTVLVSLAIPYKANFLN